MDFGILSQVIPSLPIQHQLFPIIHIRHLQNRYTHHATILFLVFSSQCRKDISYVRVVFALFFWAPLIHPKAVLEHSIISSCRLAMSTPSPHFCLVYASDNQGTVVRSLAVVTGLSLLQKVPSSCWGPPSHLFDRNRRLSRGEGVKRPELEAEHSALFKVKKKLSCTSVPPCTFMACRGTA